MVHPAVGPNTLSHFIDAGGLQPPRPRLTPNEKYLHSEPELEHVGVLHHSGLHVLKCMFCNTYFGSKSILGHLDLHNFPRPKADAIAAALAVCKELNVPSENWDCAMPFPGGPPVEDLDISCGFACRHAGCMHAAPSKRSMEEHYTKHHSGEPAVYTKASVQHLFSLPVRYFAVEPSLSSTQLDEDEMGLLDCLIHGVIPEATAAPPIITASDDRGRTTLENHFLWDELMLPIRKSRKMLTLLGNLKERHVAEEAGGLYTKLHQAVIDWHTGLGTDMKGKSNLLDLQQFLMHGSAVPPEESVIVFSVNLSALH